MIVIFQALDLTLPDHCMSWAACNLAYFGFLRSAVFPSFSPTVHLGVAHVAVDSRTFSLCVRIRIKASKTDPRGAVLFTLEGPTPLCVRCNLILFRNGCSLWVVSRAVLSSWLCDICVVSVFPGQFFQSQLLHWSSHSSCKECHPRPSNPSHRAMDKLCLLTFLIIIITLLTQGQSTF